MKTNNKTETKENGTSKAQTRQPEFDFASLSLLWILNFHVANRTHQASINSPILTKSCGIRSALQNTKQILFIFLNCCRFGDMFHFFLNDLNFYNFF